MYNMSLPEYLCRGKPRGKWLPSVIIMRVHVRALRHAQKRLASAVQPWATEMYAVPARALIAESNRALHGSMETCVP
jgi:hypothetical protein